MIDIGFYMKVHDLKKRIMNGEKFDRAFINAKFEEFRGRTPVVYNIETTNACNMRCKMCPRTTMMTRTIETMPLDLFERIAEQLAPFSVSLWTKWERFVEKEYAIAPGDMSENHFFLYIIPKIIVLHGYGDPLLDPHMPERVKILNRRHIPSYFSCNPANIQIEKSLRMFENGLGYVKYSLESVNDERHKQIRGAASNFSEGYKNIIKLYDLKKKHGFPTKFIITMLNLNMQDQEAEFEKLKLAFEGRDVYIYLKSQDQKWYQNATHPTQSIHWLEFCQFPWSSMTIKSDGKSAECVEDFNNEIILGDARTQTLADIWNGAAYARLRADHFDLTRGIKCTEQCDMRLIGTFF